MMFILRVCILLLIAAYPLYRVFKKKDASAIGLLIAIWCSIMALGFDLAVILQPHSFLLWKGIALYFEALLCPSWLFFSICSSRQFAIRDIAISQRAVFLLSFIPLIVVLYFPTFRFVFSPDFAYDNVLFLEPLAFFFYFQIMLFMVIALFNMEATIANASHGIRWKVKFAVVGAGTIVVSFVLFFSQSLLFRSLDMGFMTARFVTLVLGMLLIVYSELGRGSDERITISRSLTYRSFVLLFAAISLFGIGIVGEGMKLFGESFNQYLFALIGAVVVVLLVLLALSERIRRKLRLMVQKNFYGEKYDYRAEWHAFTERVSSARSRDDLFKNILTAFCETFGIVGGAIFMRGRNSRHYLPVYFHEMDCSTLTLCCGGKLANLLSSDVSVIDLRSSKAEIDPDELAFLKSARSRFVIAACSNEQVVAIIVLGPPINVAEIYDDEDMNLMEALSRQVAVVFKNLRLGDELAEARDMEAFGKVAAFLLHDLKNQVYPLSLLLENAREFINEPEFQKDMLDSVEGVVSRMNALIKQLTHIPSKLSLNIQQVDLMELAQSTASLIPKGKVRFQGASVIARVDPEEMRKVFLNLYLNALEAGSDEAFEVHVGEEGKPLVKVIDFGKGIDETVLKEGLFVPFKTTKEKGLGIGLYQSKQIVEAHGGTIDATSAAGIGTTFWVNLP